jgi:hypothetical protein
LFEPTGDCWSNVQLLHNREHDTGDLVGGCDVDVDKVINAVLVDFIKEHGEVVAHTNVVNKNSDVLVLNGLGKASVVGGLGICAIKGNILTLDTSGICGEGRSAINANGLEPKNRGGGMIRTNLLLGLLQTSLRSADKDDVEALLGESEGK